MTSGAYMGTVGTYLMLFSMIKEFPLMNWIGLILATIGFCVMAHYEDEYKYMLVKIEKKVK